MYKVIFFTEDCGVYHSPIEFKSLVCADAYAEVFTFVNKQFTTWSIV